MMGISYNVPVLIASAMSAWNETFQGYPDHWAKVVGDLSLASEICDSDLSGKLMFESKSFNIAYSNGKQYRPPFEHLVAEAINQVAGRRVVEPSDVLNTQLCYDCATKHLADAGVVWDDMEMGDFNAFVEVLGNLSHASNHLIEKHPDVADIIRKNRKAIWEAFVKELPMPQNEIGDRIRDVLKAAASQQMVAKQNEEVERLMGEARKQR
jgi:hypothetical protein